MAAFKYPLKTWLSPKCWRKGWEENNFDSKRLMKLRSHISGVKLLFHTFCWSVPACTHSAALCVSVCEADYFGFLLFTHSCHVCVTSLYHHNIRCVGASRNHEWQQQKSRFKPVAFFVHLQDVVIMTSASLVCNASVWLTFKQKWLCFRRQNKLHQYFEICFTSKRAL